MKGCSDPSLAHVVQGRHLQHGPVTSVKHSNNIFVSNSGRLKLPFFKTKTKKSQRNKPNKETNKTNKQTEN